MNENNPGFSSQSLASGRLSITRLQASPVGRMGPLIDGDQPKEGCVELSGAFPDRCEILRPPLGPM